MTLREKDRAIHLVSLGCAKNRVDSEVLLGGLLAQGFVWTDDPDEAEVIVVNTCAFIRDAQKESIDTLLEMGQRRTGGRCQSLVATGCLPQRHVGELMRAMPEIDHFVGTGHLNEVAARLWNGTLPKNFVRAPGFIHAAQMPRVRSTPHFTAFLKVSEGCNNRCAFCVIPSIRGGQRSRAVEDVVAEARALALQGCVEVNLIAQDLTAYGRDLPGRPNLEELLRALVAVEGLRWIRLHYAYPRAISDELIDILAGEEKVVPYLDIPLQHISDRLLRAMHRGSSAAFIRELMDKLRARVPGIALRTSLISGLPGETEEDHAALLDFVRSVRFERLGVFEFSAEAGTEAAAMPDQVPAKVARRRRREIMALQRKINREQNRALVGKTLEVLVEGVSPESDDLLAGRHAGQAIEVDGITYINDGLAQPGQIVKVEVTQAADYDVVGHIVGAATSG